MSEAERISGISRNRLRLYFSDIQLQPHKPLPSHSAVIQIVDSGPQVSPLVDNLLEYLPPIFLWLFVLNRVGLELTEYVQLTTLMWILHFLKRVFEVLFVHTFSRPSLPIFSIRDNAAFKNCAYYWAFTVAMALNMAMVARRNDGEEGGGGEAGLGIWCISEILNGYCHMALKKMRPNGSTAHVCPKGFLFNKIVAPNYTFEILAWVGFAMYSRTVVGVVFALVGGIQMFLWADEKRRTLALQFPSVARRGRIFPFL
jgi:very-long-chain enoyl-CoA reductase